MAQEFRARYPAGTSVSATPENSFILTPMPTPATDLLAGLRSGYRGILAEQGLRPPSSFLSREKSSEPTEETAAPAKDAKKSYGA